MQSMVRGPGTGGRVGTVGTGIPPARATAASRRGFLLPPRRFEPRLVAAPTLDQPVHQIARAGMRDVVNLGADIDHGVALQHAELEIIEINQLHRYSSPLL